ncbi:glutamine--fructose-6-phosphate transaminase (isomerizing) [Halorientalis pallida]|uniref:Glutamine--fructose-6-phosphate aminotransferase [isomerizing] n=1 Tax=Halorientalis pallida TaxID=2479928 RepID=A0A498KS69_9EURY|nr:glutamine--fructose-6-phosphate transaminase (isomerizing) [Halorientalis pallida]RXK47417.1 glutamine--fructose-6-phosphate transaminase (isomerizing) [Halorientalis pallida]
MCGIIGCAGRDGETLDVLVHGLSKLEYRGYDSAGVALAGSDLDVCKTAGEIDELRAALEERSPSGSVGIGHTRWSTHGPPTDENAHPHLDCNREVAVVHNGIIENYQELRDELSTAGHEFRSDTDTEVVPHLIEDALADGADPEDAVRQAVARLEGSYAVCVVMSGVDRIFAARNDSPLVLGVDGEARSASESASGDEPRAAYYLASDVPAFRDHTDRVVYLADGEFAVVDADGYRVTTLDGEPVEKTEDTVDWDPEETGKSGYDHFMLKEIHEQPRALRQCFRGRVDELSGTVDLADLGDLSPRGVQLVACGTSYHAAVYAAQLFQQAGIPAQAFLASEYATSPPPIGDALVIGVTQSGETADTLSALREARRRGARTLAVTNTVGSTVARECDHAMYIRAGPEIGVAATKTFSSQIAALNLLSLAITSVGDSREVISGLRDLPGAVQEILDTSTAQEIAETYRDAESYFFIGRGLHYPVALEGALKMKEITYKHAEGFAAGELKHGPLALVTSDTPVFAVVTGDDEQATKTVGNVKEVEARDAPVVAVTDGASDVERYADHVLEVPDTHRRVAAVVANVQLQLVAYHTADMLGRSIDKPRNLAKSVTVE